MARMKSDECEPNMTPMIDVVFQLIIFFVLTLTMTEQKNEEIQLAQGPHGPEMLTPADDPRMNLALVLEVDTRGGFFIFGRKVRPEEVRQMIQRRYNKYGAFPVMIRGDRRTPHRHIKKALDIITECGIARVSFVALKKEGDDSKGKD